jgi:hypothetical protein
MKMYSKKKIEKSLIKKGFVATDGDHEFLVFLYNGNYSKVHTKLSHGTSSPGRDILQQIKKQLKLNSQREFERLIDCPMSKSEYEDILKEQGILI